jgi:hypothetical protein
LHEIVLFTDLNLPLGVVVVVVDVFVVAVAVVAVVDAGVEPLWPLAVCVRLAMPTAVATPADATSTVRSERLIGCT